MGLFGFGKRDSSNDIPEDDEDAAVMAPAHPAFTAHFTDSLYDEEGGEFAPFGSDEGADTLAAWTEWRDELSPATTVREMFVEDQGDFWDDAVNEVRSTPRDGDSVDGAVFLVSYAFTLLRLAGHIDPEGQDLGLAALGRLIAVYGDDIEELQTQHRDLASWVNPSP